MILQTNYTLTDLSKKPSESTFVLTYGRVPLTLTEQIKIDYIRASRVHPFYDR